MEKNSATEATYQDLRQPVADLVATINGLGSREQEIVIAAVMSSRVGGQTPPVLEAVLFAEIERLQAELTSTKQQVMGGDSDCDHENTDEKRKRCVMCEDCGALIEMVD